MERGRHTGTIAKAIEYLSHAHPSRMLTAGLLMSSLGINRRQADHALEFAARRGLVARVCRGFYQVALIEAA